MSTHNKYIIHVRKISEPKYFGWKPNLFAMFYKLDSFLNIYYSQEEIFSRQNGFNFFHQLQRVQKSSRSRKNLSCRADSATAQHTSRSCEFISKHEIFLSRWRKKYPKGNLCGFWPLGKKRNHLGKVYTIVEFKTHLKSLPANFGAYSISQTDRRHLCLYV